MTLPSVITLNVSSPDGGDLSGLIFQLRVTSGTKNLYYIYFKKTSADGTTCLTSEDFRGQFNDHVDMFIMDYNGSIESASNLVGVNLFDPTAMSNNRQELSRWPLSKHERAVWDSKKAKIDYFLSSRNKDYYFFEESVRIPPDGLIHLTVGRKIGRQG
jgi:hypothetical protein